MQKAADAQGQPSKLTQEISLLREENKQLNFLKTKLIQKIEDFEADDLTGSSSHLKLYEWVNGVDEHFEKFRQNDPTAFEVRRFMKSLQQFTFAEVQRLKAKYKVGP